MGVAPEGAQKIKSPVTQRFRAGLNSLVPQGGTRTLHGNPENQAGFVRNITHSRLSTLGAQSPENANIGVLAGANSPGFGGNPGPFSCSVVATKTCSLLRLHHPGMTPPQTPA